MNSSDKRGLTFAQKSGCALFAVVCLVFSIWGFAVAALGHCVTAADGGGCENEGIDKFLLFPGLPILSVAAGVGLIVFLKWRNSR